MKPPNKPSDEPPFWSAGPPFLRRLWRWGERLLAVIGLCFILYHFAFEITVMTSDSMAPTLQGRSFDDGDRIVLEKITGYFRSPQRWEIFFFYNADGIPVAKRIVGLPGEKISIRKNRIYINGTELQRPRDLPEVKYYGYGNLANGQEADCGQGYFTLGDASNDSYDSRYTGVVGKSAFRGRVLAIVWPVARIGFVR